MIIICIISIVLTVILLFKNITLRTRFKFLLEILKVFSKIPIPGSYAEEIYKDIEKIQDEYGIHIIELKEKE